MLILNPWFLFQVLIYLTFCYVKNNLQMLKGPLRCCRGDLTQAKSQITQLTQFLMLHEEAI